MAVPKKMNASINILIVDDEPNNLTALEAILDDPGYRLVRAESAEQALLALGAEEFALLILDIRMPGMTGFELARIIKGRKKTERVPIIFLTAFYNEYPQVLEGYGRGAVDYLQKPVNPAMLRSKVAVFVELHRNHNEVAMANRTLLAEVIERRRTEEQLRELNLTLQADIIERERLEHEILEISEREQCRLGQDLHDGLGQELAGIALLGKVLANQLQEESHPLAKAAADIATYIRDTIESARRLSKGLYPVELSRYGLLIALEDLANQTTQRIGISCELRQSGNAPKMAKSAEIHIYRIVQECIGNAIRHGQADRIIIESVGGDRVHTFTVTDNGVGFEKQAVKSGMGLHLMEYRARVIGAEIDVRKPAEGGCQVMCQLLVPTGK